MSSNYRNSSRQASCPSGPLDDVETENLENYLQEEIETLDDEELNMIL